MVPAPAGSRDGRLDVVAELPCAAARAYTDSAGAGASGFADELDPFVPAMAEFVTATSAAGRETRQPADCFAPVCGYASGAGTAWVPPFGHPDARRIRGDAQDAADAG